MFEQNHGFTLIELLVVVAIISLLMAIMLPALTSVRERSRTAVCLSNLRQLSHAVSGFVGEAPHGRIVSTNQV
jgi:prepilin-type N-terminal cleavage/methylation domain-containing protein